MITLIDFDDSFSYNIFSVFKKMNQSVEVKHHLDTDWDRLDQYSSKDRIILGPGPGHPDEYTHVLQALKNGIGRFPFMLGGICLGHQLIGQALGHQLKRCIEPCHGQNFPFRLPNWDVFPVNRRNKIVDVQRYNSFAVKNSKAESSETKKLGVESVVYEGQEVISFYKPDHILSYQFHPESVGTSHPELFLSPYIN